ncbi:MAG: aminomethyl-transferring glycine dehydrogenase subunit GcvPA [Silvanigrellales bacterium]|nr:aminomethyl-transferring glycine dehydrogenase subunit GcvPA [Silvanigrellales bacterium]
MGSHRFLPNTLQDRDDILQACGVKSVEDLLVGIPAEVRFKGTLENGPALSEMEIRKRIHALTRGSRHAQGGRSFLGAGVYEHFCPAVVNQLTLRGEFLTSYTPYQPEMSQGTLQVLFEFQTMVADLFGMEVSNASHYDGSTSFAEAALMAARLSKGRARVLVSRGVHPEYFDVMKTYVANIGIELVPVPLDNKGQTSQAALKSLLAGDGVAAVMCQSPNFFGCVEDQETLAGLAKGAGAVFVTNVAEPLSLGLLKPPGAYGADIATGEGQSFGVPPSFGGPFVGLFTSRMEYVRQMPGRLCGETVDAKGRRAFTLTLSTREQHIRREKATSNICTNQNLFALWATIWLSMVGKEGFKEMAHQNFSKAEYAKDAILKTGKATLRYSSPTFNEFTVDVPSGAAAFAKACVARGVAPGVALSRFDPNDETGLLVCVTELKSRAELDELAALFKALA